ncbi:intermediate cleaving peptidase 55, mitochondrial-like [Diospyros lotus]|uniref:intermediate cleaving peptidase 55, mitochondrial-like n=1 Tax=Diospyros lotus TaxID=55363 RepID=UPI002258DBD1|nr:intermediate cleaving peptidase 55, mitochondrial-like [Diospyros lotus]
MNRLQKDVIWQGKVAGAEAALDMFKAEQSYSMNRLQKEFIWQGKVAGAEAALDMFKAEQSYSMNRLQMILPDMIRSSSNLYHNVKTATRYTKLEAFQKADNDGKVKDFCVYTHEARWIKSPAELKLTRDFAAIGCQALLQTMLHSKAFPYESMLSARVEYECNMRDLTLWLAVGLMVLLHIILEMTRKSRRRTLF